MDWFFYRPHYGGCAGIDRIPAGLFFGALVIAGDPRVRSGRRPARQVAIQRFHFAVLLVYWDRFMGLLLPGRVQTSAPKPLPG